jgi:stage V sporulation protein R
MNEGWASYWHARLLREAEFLPQDEYLEAIKTHSDVVRPIAGDQQVALNINPYHLGFVMWEKIIEEQGLEAARQIMREDDDFGFIRNHLTEELAHELDLFVFQARSNGEIKVQEFDVDLLRESILGAKFNFGAPAIFVVEMAVDGSLTLGHDHATDKRGLDLDRAEKVLRYLHRIWRRPIKINTVDAAGKEKVLSVS